MPTSNFAEVRPCARAPRALCGQDLRAPTKLARGLNKRLFMQRLCVLGAATLCLGLCARGAGSYSTYLNARYGYAVLYPTGLVKPQPEAPNGDGRVFKSLDGKTTLSVWGQYNVSNRTLRGQMNFAKEEWAKDQGRVTYWKMGRGFYVLSGLTGEQIFYEKTVPISGGFATMLWQYPKNQRAKFDAALTRTTRAFGSAERVSAHVTTVPRVAARTPVDAGGY